MNGLQLVCLCLAGLMAGSTVWTPAVEMLKKHLPMGGTASGIASFDRLKANLRELQCFCACETNGNVEQTMNGLMACATLETMLTARSKGLHIFTLNNLNETPNPTEPPRAQ
jgi:hypothetical protein